MWAIENMYVKSPLTSNHTEEGTTMQFSLIQPIPIFVYSIFIYEYIKSVFITIWNSSGHMIIIILSFTRSFLVIFNKKNNNISHKVFTTTECTIIRMFFVTRYSILISYMWCYTFYSLGHPINYRLVIQNDMMYVPQLWHSPGYSLPPNTQKIKV